MGETEKAEIKLYSIYSSCIYQTSQTKFTMLYWLAFPMGTVRKNTVWNFRHNFKLP